MVKTKVLMGMPITVNVAENQVTEEQLDEIFEYFKQVDARFSTYKADSEISMINNKKLKEKYYSREMKEVLRLCEVTKNETAGYFDIRHEGRLDPSGLVKGWAINQAANRLADMGYKNYYVDAGGDIQTAGTRSPGKKWRVGIRNPFNRYQNVKIIRMSGEGVATSGADVRGQHVYNPVRPGEKLTEIVSLTVIGPNIYEADRIATAAFAMGREGINFINKLSGLAGYMIDKNGMANATPGWEQYEVHR